MVVGEDPALQTLARFVDALEDASAAAFLSRRAGPDRKSDPCRPENKPFTAAGADTSFACPAARQRMNTKSRTKRYLRTVGRASRVEPHVPGVAEQRARGPGVADGLALDAEVREGHILHHVLLVEALDLGGRERPVRAEMFRNVTPQVHRLEQRALALGPTTTALLLSLQNVQAPPGCSSRAGPSSDP